MVQVIYLTIVKYRDAEVVDFAQVVKLDVLNLCFFPTGHQLPANLHSPDAFVPVATHLDITARSLEGINDDSGNHITSFKDIDERGL